MKGREVTIPSVIIWRGGRCYHPGRYEKTHKALDFEQIVPVPFHIMYEHTRADAVMFRKPLDDAAVNRGESYAVLMEP
jgi:hypothetical protein